MIKGATPIQFNLVKEQPSYDYYEDEYYYDYYEPETTTRPTRRVKVQETTTEAAQVETKVVEKAAPVRRKQNRNRQKTQQRNRGNQRNHGFNGRTVNDLYKMFWVQV